MENLENIVKHAEHVHHPNTKDEYVDISKNTFSDIRELVGDHKPTSMDFKVTTCKNENDPVCVTILTVSVSDSEWSASDDFMHAYRDTSLSVSNVERSIKDMAEYYKKELLKLA